MAVRFSQKLRKSASLTISVSLYLLLMGTSAWAQPTFDREAWTHGHTFWEYNHPGMWGPPASDEENFLGSNEVSCVATDGSGPSSEFWAAGTPAEASQKAFNACLDFVNIADRNPAYITVECGF